MSNMEKDLKEIKKGQNKIIRKLEFIINSVMFTFGLVNVMTSDSTAKWFLDWLQYIIIKKLIWVRT